MKDLLKRRQSDDASAGRERETTAPARRPQAVEAGRRVATPGQRISPTVSTAAIAEAENALEAAHTSGDYRFQSVGDLLRAALQAYATGLSLTQQAKSGARKRHTVELSPDLMEHYRKLPSRSRGKIIERALLSMLAQGFE